METLFHIYQCWWPRRQRQWRWWWQWRYSSHCTCC